MIPLLAACGVEQDLVVETGTVAPAPAPSPSPSPSPVPVPVTAPAPVVPRPPGSGDLVITELHIDPDGVPDADGEWFEVLSLADAPLVLDAISLADDGVDDTPLLGGGQLAPGGRAVWCAVADPAVSGGVACDATWYHQEFGGGMALANPADELEIRAGTTLVDRVSWVEQAPVGASRALAAGRTDNDADDAWCVQAPSPGSENQSCP